MDDLRGAGALVPARLAARLVAATAAAATVVAGLGVRAALTGDTAKYRGDALYTTLLYALVLVLAPRVRPSIAAGTALAVSWAVEFAQLGTVPADGVGEA